MPSHRTILLTGFGPFPGVEHNASAMIVKRIEQVAARRLANHTIVTHVLPTQWQGLAERLSDLVHTTRPFMALHFGVSCRARGFEIEAVARNMAIPHPDAHGCWPRSRHLAPSSPLSLTTKLPAREAVDALRRLGLNARLSRDAGGYLCNAAYYHSLLQSRGHRGHDALFVHIPTNLRLSSCSHRAPRLPTSGMSEVQAIHGSLRLIEVLLHAERHP